MVTADPLPVGTWSWRVCAWGVVQPTLDPTVQQLQGGCSPARSLTVVRRPVDAGPVDVTDTGTVERTWIDRSGPTAPTEITSDRVAPRTTTSPARRVAGDRPHHETREPAPGILAAFEPLGRRGVSQGSILAASLAMSSDDAGVITSVLGWNLPLFGLPFWILLLLIVSFLLVRRWHRDIVTMFDDPSDDSETSP